MNKKLLLALLGATLSLTMIATGVGCKSKKSDKDKEIVYEGEMLYNGFDSVQDLYRIDQMYTWGFQPLNGKLEIVNKDNFIPGRVIYTNYQEVIDKINALPELANVTFANKEAIVEARNAYTKLNNESKAKVTNLSKLETLEASDALEGIYTIGDFGGDFVGNLQGITKWQGLSGKLIDETSGTVMFKATNLNPCDGSVYISLFHDSKASKGNSSDGIVLRVDNSQIAFENSSPAISAIQYEGGKTLSSSETYTFTICYAVAQDYSKLTVSIKIEDSEGILVNGVRDITSFNLKNFENDGPWTIETWIKDHARKDLHKTFYINTGYSDGLNLIDAFTATDIPDVHNEADLSPRQGDGALRVYYGNGQITNILARFEESLLSGLPVNEIGNFSLKIYNDSAEEKRVNLSLMLADNVVLEVDGGTKDLAPYAWTTCTVTLKPVIIEYYKDELIGINIAFENKSNSVYYVDDFRIKFGPEHTQEEAANIEKVNALETEIEAFRGKTVTVADGIKLNQICLDYGALPQEYRYTIENLSVLEQAVADYLSITSATQLATEAKEEVVSFDSAIGIMQITSVAGGEVSYTSATDEKAPGADGSMKFVFDGTAIWGKVSLSPTKANEFDEIHVWVNNVSASPRAVQLTWNVADAAYDVEGNPLTVGANGMLPANSGWTELVFYQLEDSKNPETKFPLTEINTASLTPSGTAIESVDTLLVGSIEFVYKYNDVIAIIDALDEDDPDFLTAVAVAREAYNNLCWSSKEKVTNYSDLVAIETDIAEEFVQMIGSLDVSMSQEIAYVRESYDKLPDNIKSKITNINVLYGLEADVWEATLVGLPEASTINSYTLALATKLGAIRAEYEALCPETKAEVENLSTLVALENALGVYGTIVARPGNLAVTTAASGWYKYQPDPEITEGYDVAYVLIKNDSNKNIAFQVNWNACNATYDSTGALTTNIVSGYVVPANSGWITLEYTKTSIVWSELNIAHFAAGASTASQGDIDVTIASITFISYAPAVDAMIEALDATNPDPSDVDEAYEAYEDLSDGTKPQVSNLAKLWACMAIVWSDNYMDNLPASTDDVTEWNQAGYQAVLDALTAYGQLEDGIKANLTTEKALLDALKAKYETFQGEIVEELIQTITNLDGTDAEAVATARATYEVLTADYKDSVNNASVLFGYEADLWEATLTALPDASTITSYDIGTATDVILARAGYEALYAEAKAYATEGLATLTALENAIANYGTVVATPGKLALNNTEGWQYPAIGYTSSTGSDKVYLLIRNDSAEQIAFYITGLWHMTVAVYDENGTQLSNLKSGYIIPANSGWLTLEYAGEKGIDQLVVANFPGDDVVPGDLDVTVAAIVFISNAPSVVAMIEALDVDNPDPTAVANARSAYNALSDGTKTQVSNLSVLYACEAKLWSNENMAGLPASADGIVEFDVTNYNKVVSALADYATLEEGVQAYLTEELALLNALEEAYEACQSSLIDTLIQAIENIDGDNPDPTAVAGARQSYEVLSSGNKELVTNRNELFSYEAALWRATLSDLPAVSEVTSYDVGLATELSVIRAGYEALYSEAKALITTELDTLTALENALAVFGTKVYDFTSNIDKVTTPDTLSYSATEQALEISHNNMVVGEYLTIKLAGTTLPENAEIHVFVKNTTNKEIVLLLGASWSWPTSEANGAVFANVWNGKALPANGGWLELVYTGVTGAQEIRVGLPNAADSGALYIKQIVCFTSAQKVNALIAGLDATNPDQDATQTAYEAYVALTDKTTVIGADKLYDCVAKIWKGLMMNGLPTDATQVESFDQTNYGKVLQALESIDYMGDATFEAEIAEEITLLNALKDKYEGFSAEVISNVETLISEITGVSDADAILAARAAYDALSSDLQAQVENRETLFGYEADAWEATVTGLPEVSEITGYDVGVATKLIMLAETYDALPEEVVALVDEGIMNSLDAVSQELYKYGAVVATPGQITGTGKTWYSQALSLTGSYDVAYVWVRNNKSDDIAFQINWNVAPVVYNQNGKTITADDKNGVITTSNEWVVLEFTKTDIVWSQINIAHFAEGNGSDGDIDVTVAMIVFATEEHSEVPAPPVDPEEPATYTLSDLGGDFTNNLDKTISGQKQSLRATLVNQMAGTIVFKASGLKGTADGSIYISLFQDGIVNAGEAFDGVCLYLLNTGGVYVRTAGTISANGTYTISSNEVYTFTISYEVVADYSKVTITVEIKDSNGTIMTSGSLDVTRIVPADNSQTALGGNNISIKDWLTTHANKDSHNTFFIGSGASDALILHDIDWTEEPTPEPEEPATYTLSDLGLKANNASLSSWAPLSGTLVNEMEGTVAFKATGLAVNDGSLYVSLFHDGSVNAGQAGDGLMILLRADDSIKQLNFDNCTPKLVKDFESGMSISSSETYTIYVSYLVASDYSKVTLTVTIKDSSDNVIVTGSADVTSFTPASSGLKNSINSGAWTISEWLQTHANVAGHKNKIFIGTGNSSGVTLQDYDYVEPVATTVYDFTDGADTTDMRVIDEKELPMETVELAYSADQQALEITFDGLATGTWANLKLATPEVAEYTEVHIFVKNTTNSRVVLQADWTLYDADATETKLSELWGATCIPANGSEWIEIVYIPTADKSVANWNIALENEVTTGALYIQQIVVY